MNSIIKQIGQDSILLYFPASLENIDDAVIEIEKFLVQKKMGEFSFEVILVSREALINAVVYGCESNPDKNVNVELRIEPTCLVIEIEDQGPGFDWQGCLKRALPDKKTSGRGLYIMKTYCDKIFYN
ncbi:MAG: ATP-binding protein, partial [Deltaproteobacteria bacterium]|nr:ATP-binding protein [Deltaproteobacteria bacterium]